LFSIRLRESGCLTETNIMPHKVVEISFSPLYNALLIR